MTEPRRVTTLIAENGLDVARIEDMDQSTVRHNLLSHQVSELPLQFRSIQVHFGYVEAT